MADEVPLDFNDMHVKPDPKYGVPPVNNNNNPNKNNNPNNNNNNLSPPSPTYGVPGHNAGSPSTRTGSYPNAYQPPPVFVSTPAPTYGPPKNAYIPPITNFQVIPSIQNPNYYSGSQVPKGTSPDGGGGGGAGYVYNKPNANLKSSPMSAKLQAKQDLGDDDSKSDEEEEGSIRSIQFTTETPRAAPDFFFSEQFEQPPPPPPVVTSSLPILQQHAFHPQEQPFLPNSPPAPFSTAVYQQEQQQQQRNQKLQQQQQQQEQADQLTLSEYTQPPSPKAKNYYDSQPVQSQTNTNYNQAEWFRRISRSLTNESEIVEVKRVERNETFLSEMRSKKELLKSLLPSGEERDEEEVDEDLMINFEAAHALGGNRTRRTKRQSIGSNRLCETTTQFIEPQAALTRDGRWSIVLIEDSVQVELHLPYFRRRVEVHR